MTLVKPADEIFKDKTGDIVALFVDNSFAVGLTPVRQFYHATKGKTDDPNFRDLWFSIRCKTEATYRRETSKYEFGVDIPDIDTLERTVPSMDVEIFIFIIVSGEEKVYVTSNKLIHRFGRKWQDEVNFPKGIYFIERTRCMSLSEFSMWFIDWLTPKTTLCDLSPESHEPPSGYRMFKLPSDGSRLIEFLNDASYVITSKYVDNSSVICFYETRDRIDEEQRVDIRRCMDKAKFIRESPQFPAYKDLKNATAREIYLVSQFNVGAKDMAKVMELLKDEMAWMLPTSTSKG